MSLYQAMVNRFIAPAIEEFKAGLQDWAYEKAAPRQTPHGELGIGAASMPGTTAVPSTNRPR